MPSIAIAASDGAGSFSAYVVEPAQKPAGVVVLIQEIFGVNQAMRDIAAWVADLGFIAVCPDLFWRIEPGVEGYRGPEGHRRRRPQVAGKQRQGRDNGLLPWRPPRVHDG